MIGDYAYEIADAVRKTEGRDAVDWVIECFERTHSSGGRVFLIGNGGSAAIASHIAIDLSKNAGVRALALNDASALTCSANDYGFEDVFVAQLHQQATDKDALVAISSSGASTNMIKAIEHAVMRGMTTITFSGNVPSSKPNRLKDMGSKNFFTASDKYGIVENAHQITLHYIVDRLCERRSRVNF